MKGRPWTEAECARLLELAATGASHRTIAAELGRPAGAIGTKLYSLRHPDRAEAIQRAYMERQGDRARERQAEHYRANRPRLIAAHREYYAANRDQVLARQADRRRDEATAEHVRIGRRASQRRNAARHCEAQKARNAVAKARAGDARYLGKLTGLSTEDTSFWLVRLPAGCVARTVVAKLRTIAEMQDELRPQVRRILSGVSTGRGHGSFGAVVPLFGGDRG